MKIVIDIPEEVFDEIYNKNYYSLKGKEALRIAVRGGAPLPIGHGELKDTDTIRKEMLCRKYSDSFCEEHHIDHSINTEIALAIIDNAPTIIEASKEGEE